MHDRIEAIFDGAQRKKISVVKAIASLNEIFSTIKGSQINAFTSSILKCIKSAMLISNVCSAADIIIEVAGKFIASKFSDEDQFCNSMLTFFMEAHNSELKSIRLRCCQLINYILSFIEGDSDISEELHINLQNALLKRLRDRFSEVRAQAVLAARRLQDSEDPECPIIQAYIYLLNVDINPCVRKAILKSMVVTTVTLASIMRSVRDISPIVRTTAYEILADHVCVTSFTSEQRMQLISQGLLSNKPIIKNACAKMIRSWTSMVDGDYIKLLSLLSVVSQTDICKLALETLLEDTDISGLVQSITFLNEEKLIPSDKLSVEIAFFWNFVLYHIKEKCPGEGLLDDLLPSLTNLAKYLKDLLTKLSEVQCTDETIYSDSVQSSQEFMISQILKLFYLIDVSTDEYGRLFAMETVESYIINCSESNFIEDIASLLFLFSLHRQASIEKASMLISDIKEPLTNVENVVSSQEKIETDFKLARIKVDLYDLNDKLQESINSKNYDEASLIMNKIKELESDRDLLVNDTQPAVVVQRVEKDDSLTIFKCLSIISALFKSFKKIITLPSDLDEICESVILPSVANTDDVIRQKAVECLGILGLFNKEFANKAIIILIQVIKYETSVDIQITALQGLFDFFLRYKLSAFVDNPFNFEVETTNISINATFMNSTLLQNSEQGNMVDCLIRLLDSPNADIRCCVAEGFCKLLLHDRFSNQQILCRLILIWFSPMTRDEPVLRQCLSLFFPMFTSSSVEHQEAIKLSIVPVMRSIDKAPLSSHIASIDPNNLLSYLITLTTLKIESTTDEEPEKFISHQKQQHKDIANILLKDILSDVWAARVPHLLKALLELHLDSSDKDFLTSLQSTVENLVNLIEMPSCSKLCSKFLSHINTLLTQ